MKNKDFLEKAIELAHYIHKDEVDKAGKPYILHPLAVSELLDDDIDKAIGVLHDTIESNPEALNMLKDINAPEEVIEALKLLTRDLNDTYKEYIFNLADSRNIRAIKVKLADISHNTSPERMDHLPEKTSKSLKKRYSEAKAILEPVLDKLVSEVEVIG